MPVIIPIVIAVASYAAAAAVTSAFLLTGLTAILVGAAVGAVVGAAIGGIGAAITDGDIGKGVLYGAIGGAVAGGMGGWMSDGGLATGATSGAEGAASYGEAGYGAAGATKAPTSIMVGGAEAAGSGLTAGEGAIGSALVTTGGTAVMGAFKEEPDVAGENAKNREASQKLAELQAATQLKIAEMRGGEASSSGSDARYTADLQLQNAREQRGQDYKMKTEDYAVIEAGRARRAEAVGGVMAGTNAPAAPTNASSIDKQVYQGSNQMYAQQQPAAPQNINRTSQPGVLQKPVGAVA